MEQNVASIMTNQSIKDTLALNSIFKETCLSLSALKNISHYCKKNKQKNLFRDRLSRFWLSLVFLSLGNLNHRFSL